MRWLILCLVVLSAPLSAAPEPGLMWNRSGLPLVFPLQVKTAPGHDYHVQLSDPESGKPVLAAFWSGGDFFRVLVPPGTFIVQIARGTDWQDDVALFGDETEYFLVADPLTFQITGMDRKEGHLIDLRDRAPGQLTQRDTRQVALCREHLEFLSGLTFPDEMTRLRAQLGYFRQSGPGLMPCF